MCTLQWFFFVRRSISSWPVIDGIVIIRFYLLELPVSKVQFPWIVRFLLKFCNFELIFNWYTWLWLHNIAFVNYVESLCIHKGNCNFSVLFHCEMKYILFRGFSMVWVWLFHFTLRVWSWANSVYKTNVHIVVQYLYSWTNPWELSVIPWDTGVFHWCFSGGRGIHTSR